LRTKRTIFTKVAKLQEICVQSFPRASVERSVCTCHCVSHMRSLATFAGHTSKQFLQKRYATTMVSGMMGSPRKHVNFLQNKFL